MRFFFYSHDGVGLGHVRRNLALAGTLTKALPSAKILVATSVDEVCRLGLPANVDTLKIPGLRKVSNAEYGARRLGLASGEIHALRSALLLGAVRSFRPDVVVVDKHPLGAGGEMCAALEAARAMGARAALGLRDILDDPADVRREWGQRDLAKRITDYYDAVLVYGSPEIFDPVREYRLPEVVARRAHYCGYVLNHFDCAWRSNECLNECPYLLVLDAKRHPIVLGTAGGGEDGYKVISAFVRAAGTEPWNSVAVAGPMISAAELKSLQRQAAARRVTMHTFIPCLSNLFGTADALVCMGGYNTLIEAAAQALPTVCVPRTEPRTEQLIRAQAFERLGLLRVVRPEHLTPARLRRAVNAALQTPRTELNARVRAALHFDGAKRAAHHLMALATPVRRASSRRAARAAG